MFSTIPTTAHKQLSSHYYSPAVSSPLSSSPQRQSPSPLAARNLNTLHYDAMLSPSKPTICYSNNWASMASWNLASSKSETPTRPRSSSPSRSSSYSKRTTKPNPLMQRGDGEGRETRRKLFLKKVKDNSEEKRWLDRNRGGEDEIMRSIWVMEERRRAEARRRAAREEEFSGVEEVDYLEEDIEGPDEEVVRMQERELEDMLRRYDSQASEHGDDQTAEHSQRINGMETPYGSDEDEYDDIFMDVIQEEMKMSSQQTSTLSQEMAMPSQIEQQQQPIHNDDVDQDMMDMS